MLVKMMIGWLFKGDGENQGQDDRQAQDTEHDLLGSLGALLGIELGSL